MAIINEGNRTAQPGILQAAALVAWKQQHGLLKVPVVPSKVIITPQLKAIKARQSFMSKEIKGLVGTHVCVDAKKGIYLSGGWGIGAPALIAVCEELHALGAGLLAAAFLDPVWSQGVRGPMDLVIAAVGFALLVFARVSALWAVLWCVAAAVTTALLA